MGSGGGVDFCELVRVLLPCHVCACVHLCRERYMYMYMYTCILGHRHERN